MFVQFFTYGGPLLYTGILVIAVYAFTVYIQYHYKALVQDQAILMGQGYKRQDLENAPEELRKQARVNSGYNTAKASLRQLENELQKFQQGVKLQVVSVAYPSEVHEAVVSAISPVVEKNGMVHLEATLQPHPHLMPGMTAIVTKTN